MTHISFSLNDLDIEAHLSYDGEPGSLSLPVGWYVEELVARRAGAEVVLSDEEYEAAKNEAARRMEA